MMKDLRMTFIGLLFGLLVSGSVDAQSDEPASLLGRSVGSAKIGNLNTLVDRGAGVGIGRLGSGGSTAVCVNSVNRFATCSSSIRYKSNIANFDAGLTVVKSLRPVSFRWTADNKEDLGLVAEEVADVEPLLVTRNENGEIEGVKYDRIGVILLNAIREQQTQIEMQQTQIDKQSEAIDQLRETFSKQQRELESLKLLMYPAEMPEEMCRPDNKD